jgi:glutathione S-transferase
MDKNERISRLEEASLEAANNGLKALLLLNGGASVAILAFLAQVFGTEGGAPESAMLIREMLRSLGFFAAGAGAAVFATFFAYYANQQYVAALLDPEKVSWNRGAVLNILGGVVALLSLGLFGVGVQRIWAAAGL